MAWQFERSEYRIPYPPSARATFTLDGRTLPLVDCSERGLRYVSQGVARPEPGATVAGTVRLLSSRQPISVQGKVVRCEGDEVAVHLASPGLPMQAIFAEQRHLARHFPARYGPGPQR
ncbi:MAG: PilZ domain-containing protein [Gemmatimonadaceae bacterium]|nr:PilZ domain-containing protein [Gemmatimonadaceae bacterium]